MRLVKSFQALFVVFLFTCASQLQVQAQYSARALPHPDPGPHTAFGRQLAAVGDLDGDGVREFIVAAGSQEVSGLNAGQVYLFRGRDRRRIATVPHPFPEHGGYFGHGVASVADVDLDGIDDFVVGASSQTSGAAHNAGEAYLFSGADRRLLFRLRHPEPAHYAYFGRAIAPTGDLDRDGIPDVMISAYNQPLTHDHQGRVYFFSGADGRFMGTLDDPSPQRVGHFGISLASLGDITGDGNPELVIGASGQHVGGIENAGRVYVFDGSTLRVMREIDNPQPSVGGAFGDDLDVAGDVDGDGKPDMVIGAWGQTVGGLTRAGAAYVLNAAGSLMFTLRTPGPQIGALFGSDVAGVGDATGDGIPDLLVGAPWQNGASNVREGSAFLFSGSDGLLFATLKHPRPQGDAWFGNSVVGLGDVNGDGLADSVAGAPDQNAGSNSRQGEAYVFLSTPMASKRIRVAQESSPGAGDFDSHVLGFIDAFRTPFDAARYYVAGDPTKQRFSGPEPALRVDESHLFFLSGADGLSLVVVHEKTGPASSVINTADTVIDVLNDPDGVRRTVEDDSSDEFTASGSGTAMQFVARHLWTQGNTDGYALSGFDGDWSALVQFLAAPVGVNAWRAHSESGAEVPLALAPGRRVRLDLGGDADTCELGLDRFENNDSFDVAADVDPPVIRRETDWIEARWSLDDLTSCPGDSDFYRVPLPLFREQCRALLSQCGLGPTPGSFTEFEVRAPGAGEIVLRDRHGAVLERGPGRVKLTCPRTNGHHVLWVEVIPQTDREVAYTMKMRYRTPTLGGSGLLARIDPWICCDVSEPGICDPFGGPLDLFSTPGSIARDLWSLRAVESREFRFEARCLDVCNPPPTQFFPFVFPEDASRLGWILETDAQSIVGPMFHFELADEKHQTIAEAMPLKEHGEVIGGGFGLGGDSVWILDGRAANVPGGLYFLKVQGLASRAAFSIQNLAPLSPLPPVTPTNVDAKVSGGDAVLLSWTDSGFDAEGFEVERARADEAFRRVATQAGAVAEYVDRDVAPGSTYRYRVRAVSETGVSEFSQTVSVQLGAAESFRRGEANGDGTVDISDAVRILGSLFGGAEAVPCADAADVNDDGKLDVSDPVALLNFLFGSGTAPRAPGHQACGLDPTADGLGCGEPGRCD